MLQCIFCPGCLYIRTVEPIVWGVLARFLDVSFPEPSRTHRTTLEGRDVDANATGLTLPMREHLAGKSICCLAIVACLL